MAWLTLPGVVAAWVLPTTAWPAPAGAAFGACLLGGVVAACLWGRIAAVALLASGWVLLRGGWTLEQRLPDALEGADVVVEGTLCDFPRSDAQAARFAFEVDAARSPDGVPARLYVSWFDAPAEPQPGETWRLRLRLRAPHGAANPAGFDFEEWLYAGGMGGTAWVRPSATTVRLATGSPACPAAAWRARLARDLQRALGERRATPYVLGMVVGATRGLAPADWDLLRRTGTTHLLAISGMNIALVCAPVLLLGRALVGLVPLLARRVPSGPGAVPALLVAAVYTALAGWAVSTVRALVMLALALVHLLAGRRAAPADLLGAAAAAVVLLDPAELRRAGFWLSFLAVAWLLAGYVAPRARGASPPLAWHRRLAGAAWGLVRLQAGLGLVLAPVTLAWFGQLSLVGTAANLLAVPAFAVLLPLTLAGAALLGPWPRAAEAALGAAAWLLERGLAGLELLGAHPWAVWSLPAPGALALVLCAAGAALLAMRRPCPGRWLGAACLLPVVAGGTRAAEGPPLRVTVLDVGQGLAVTVQTRHHTLVYDAGPAYGDRDAGSAVVVPVLQAAGVRDLDVLVVSHDDTDHRGGARAVLEAYPGALLVAGRHDDLPARRHRTCRDVAPWRWDGFEFRLLPPPGDAADWSRNDGSCVLTVRGPGVGIVVPGDIERARERQLARRGELAAADVVVAPHHGSRTSSGAEFVAATRPRYVVFSAGYRNRWHFPAEPVVRRWQAAGACVITTADSGATTFELRAAALSLVSRERAVHRHAWSAPGTDAPCGPSPFSR